MTDNLVVNKFTGDSSSAQKAIADLEKRVDDLGKAFTDGKSKAKSAAIAAKEAAAAATKATKDDAAESKKVLKNWVAYSKQADADALASRKVFYSTIKQLEQQELKDTAAANTEKKRNARVAAREKTKNEKEAAKSASAAVKADADESRSVLRNKIKYLKMVDADAAASRKVFYSTTKKLEQQDLADSRAAAREKTRIEREKAREEVRAARAAALEKKRIEREETREKKRIAREEKRIQQQQEQWVSGIVRAGAAYLGITTVLSTIIEQNEKIIAQSDEYGNKQDKIKRGFAIQAGMTALESKPFQDQINKEALNAGVAPEIAAQGATQLVSSGFTPQQAAGPALRQVLQGMIASGDAGGDVGQFALNATQFMSGAGMEKNDVNLGKVMRSMYSSKKEGNFQAQDMEQIAPAIQGYITQGGSFEEAMAGFNTMKEATNREKAATGFKIMVERLMGAKASTKRTKQLGKLGLKPEQVDLVGESLGDVGSLLNERIQALPKEDRQPFLQQFFGTEVASPVQGFLNKQGKYKEFLDRQGDVKGYEQAVATGQAGSDIATKRSAVKRELQIAKKKDDTTLVLDELEYQLREAGFSEAQIATRRLGANTRRYFGGKTEDAARYMVDYGTGGQEMYANAIMAAQELKGGEAIQGTTAWTDRLLKKYKLSNGIQPVGPPQLERPRIGNGAGANSVLDAVTSPEFQQSMREPQSPSQIASANASADSFLNAIKENTQVVIENNQLIKAAKPTAPATKKPLPVNASE